MTIEQLRYFAAVAVLKSMSKAASEIHISQSAISQSLKKLENEFGPLLLRDKSEIALTDKGRHLYRHAVHILQEVDTVILECQKNQDQVAGMLKLQVHAASAQIPKLLVEFQKLYPDVHYQIIQSQLIQDYDLRIDYAPDEKMPEGADILLDEEVLLAVPARHRFSVYSSINLEEMRNEDFILMQQGCALRELADQVCAQSGFMPNVILECESPSMLREIMKLGLGVAFLPYISWHTAIDDSIRLLHITKPECHRVLYISSPPGRQITNTTKVFRSYAISYFEQLKRLYLTGGVV